MTYFSLMRSSLKLKFELRIVRSQTHFELFAFTFLSRLCKMKKAVKFNSAERYSRHLALPEIGRAGQEAISRARVLVAGAGGLGCPVIQYLAAAGTGTLGIADYDTVELSNLQRQVLYCENDVGQPKAPLAGEAAEKISPATDVIIIQKRINAGNVRETVRDYDIVVDCTDNFPTRYFLNDACVLENKTLIYGSIYRFEGQVSVFNALLKDGSRGPNYRDLFPEPPPAELIPDCSEAGVMGALTGIIGSVQAMEAIKLITGAGDEPAGKLFIFDGLTAESKVISIPDQNIREKITGIMPNPFECKKMNYGLEEAVTQLSPTELNQWMTGSKTFVLIDVREAYEREIVHIGGLSAPLDELEKHTRHIPAQSMVVLYCKSGGRSLAACRKLREQGFSNLYNLDGGIDRWQREVDSERPVY